MIKETAPTIQLHSHIYRKTHSFSARHATTKTINTLSECTILQENHRLLSSMLLSLLLLVFDVVGSTIFIVSFISCHSGCWSCCCIITMFHYNLSTQRLEQRERVRESEFWREHCKIWDSHIEWREKWMEWAHQEAENTTLKWMHWIGKSLALNVHRAWEVVIRKSQISTKHEQIQLLSNKYNGKESAHLCETEAERRHSHTQAQMLANPQKRQKDRESMKNVIAKYCWMRSKNHSISLNIANIQHTHTHIIQQPSHIFAHNLCVRFIPLLSFARSLSHSARWLAFLFSYMRYLPFAFSQHFNFVHMHCCAILQFHRSTAIARVD